MQVDTLEYVEDEDEGETEVNDNDNDAVDEEVDNKNADQEIYDIVGDDNEEREEKKSFNFKERDEDIMQTVGVQSRTLS